MLPRVSTATRAPDDAAPLPFRDGEIIAGKYEVERILGQGGMGIVVSAHHIALQQKVAIKLLLPASMSVPGAAPRFLREARSAAAIQSEHVARVLDVGTLDSGQPFMVMEYLTGSDLGGVLHRTGRLPITDAVDYVLQACEAIAEAHARGIVHRDLKPDNVFLTRRADGSSLVKILDFGLSKPAMEELSGAATPSLTGANMVAGSPQYMSPEQVRSLKNVDHRTDVWSLGVLLYELLTGQRPFEADTIAGVFAKIAADAPLRPRTLRPDMPPSLEAVVMRCLEKDLSLRTQDVASLATGLEPHAPPASRTSVERIVRLGAPAGRAALSHPVATSAPQQPSGADSMEADIPTMAAPDGYGAPGASPPAPVHSAVQDLSRPPVGGPSGASRPLVGGDPSGPPFDRASGVSRPLVGGDPSGPPFDVQSGVSAGHASDSHNLYSSPSAEAQNPSLRARKPDMGSVGLELAAVRSVHPAERGRVSSRPSLDEAPPPPIGDLRLGGPIGMLVVAILVAAADMVLARTQGSPVSFGPVTALWLAGPLAIAGAIWLVARILNR